MLLRLTSELVGLGAGCLALGIEAVELGGFALVFRTARRRFGLRTRKHLGLVGRTLLGFLGFALLGCRRCRARALGLCFLRCRGLGALGVLRARELVGKRVRGVVAGGLCL